MKSMVKKSVANDYNNQNFQKIISKFTNFCLGQRTDF